LALWQEIPDWSTFFRGRGLENIAELFPCKCSFRIFGSLTTVEPLLLNIYIFEMKIITYRPKLVSIYGKFTGSAGILHYS